MLISMCNNVYGIVNIYNGHTTTYIANNIICCYLANCFNGLGRGYNGTMNITRSGKTCQRWSEQAPHQFILSSKQYPEIAGGHNYCRNPGSRAPEGPWCFTTDPNTRWNIVMYQSVVRSLIKLTQHHIIKMMLVVWPVHFEPVQCLHKCKKL